MTSQTQLKLCKMCKHHYETSYSSWCERNKKMNLVTGQTELNGFLCDDERSHGYVKSILYNTCGKHGRFFELEDSITDGEFYDS